MPEGLALEFSGLTKRFAAVTAVSDFTARVEPGVVTGFLGPNGAGKTTTLRVLLGLVRPTAGHATIGGLPYAKLKRPLHTVGAVLEASSFHPGRSGAAHLRTYAHAASLPMSRVDEVLGLVGLADAAGRKVGGYSLGMRQRLGLAYALLGDPGVFVLDEPANGLDPEGIKWMRVLLRQLAGEGRTVLVSSHLLAEVAQSVDSLLIIAQGRLVFQGPLEDLVDPSEHATVVDSPDRPALLAALTAAGVPHELLRSGVTVRGVEPSRVGAVAAAAGVALSALQQRGPALEEVFLDLVNGTRVHPSATAAAVVTAGATDAATAAASTETPADEPAAAATTGAEAAAGEGAREAVEPAEPVAAQPVSAQPAPAEPAGPVPAARIFEPDAVWPEDEAAAADAEAAETSRLASTFDTQTRGTPEAAFVASAIAAAAAAYRGDEPTTDEAAPSAEKDQTADAARETPRGEDAAASEAASAVDAEPEAETVPAADVAASAVNTEPDVEAVPAAEEAAPAADETVPAADGDTPDDFGPSADSAAEPSAEAAVEQEPVDEGQPSPGAAPEADGPSTAADTAGSPAPATAAFAVASTGIIDIVAPPADPAAEAPDEASEVGVESTGEVGEDLASTEEGGVFAMPASPRDEDLDLPEGADVGVEALAATDQERPAPDGAADEAARGEASVPPSEPGDETERPWGEYVKTEADLEADRFFASFDGSGAGAGTSEGPPETDDGPPDDTVGEETGPAAATDEDRHEHEGGEPR